MLLVVLVNPVNVASIGEYYYKTESESYRRYGDYR